MGKVDFRANHNMYNESITYAQRVAYLEAKHDETTLPDPHLLENIESACEIIIPHDTTKATMEGFALENLAARVPMAPTTAYVVAMFKNVKILPELRPADGHRQPSAERGCAVLPGLVR